MRRVVLVSGLLLLLASSPASAQRTGGHFGGSRSFGRSSYHGGSSYRGSSYRGGSSYRSSSYHSGGSSYHSTPTSSSTSSSSYHYDPPPRPTAIAHVRPAASYGVIRHVDLHGDPVAAPDDRGFVGDRVEVVVDPPNVPRGFAIGALVFMPLALVTALATRRRDPSVPLPVKERRDVIVDSGSCTVRRISIAFDWTRRRELQAMLDSIAGQVDTSSAAGLFEAAKRARHTIASAMSAARYAMFQSVALPPAKAEVEFARQAKSLQERFGQLTILGGARVAGPDGLFARREEGPGFVVVSLVVASTASLPPLPDRLDAEAVTRALRDLVPQRAEQLVGLEVVWSPSEDADRLSSAELEAVYPELLPIDGVERVGRVSCGYCHAIYARELVHCPACGANDPHASRAPTAGFTTIACGFCGRQTPSYEVQCEHCGARAS